MMKTVKLPFIQQLDRQLKRESNLLQVILGPRQVGKTTTILDYIERELSGKANYVSADLVFNTSPQWLTEQWLKAQQDQKTLIIDEIQKCENWAETIKGLWDSAKRMKQSISCVLLGSSSLQIQKGLTESLTGRFQLILAHHWNHAESKEGYELSFEEFLKIGGYPGSYQFGKDLSEWRNYVKNSIISTVIEKDILQYQTVKSPALFRQAFEIILSYPAQEISFTKLLGQIQDKGNVELIKHYIHLYEGAFLVKALEKYSPKKLKTKSSSPKILPLAPCLYYVNALEPYTDEVKGRIFELVVGAQLFRTGAELMYWREGKYEVDYVLKRGKTIWGIEVKSGRKKALSGLTEFSKRFPTARTALITMDNYFTFEKDPMAFLEP